LRGPQANERVGVPRYFLIVIGTEVALLNFAEHPDFVGLELLHIHIADTLGE
jgi:hypothetical protein